MPQQLLVLEAERVESLGLTLALQLETVKDLDLVVTFGVGHVLLDYLIVGTRRFQRADLALESVVLGVDRVLLKRLFIGLLAFTCKGAVTAVLVLLTAGSLERYVYVNQRLDEVYLLLELVHVIDDVRSYVATAEVVRYKRVELAAQLLHNGTLRRLRDLATS